MLRPVIAGVCALTLLAACGADGDDERRGGGGRPPRPAADLEVAVRPQGPAGPVRRHRIECERLGPRADEPVCRRLEAERLEPVPETMPCTAIYGGPALARLTGTIRGKPVDARFDLSNGCEIARWERNRELLGAVP
jgi:hypothetical protein